MKPNCSLPCSQKPATKLCYQLFESSPHLHTLFIFDTQKRILPSTHMFRFLAKILYPFFILHPCYMSSHLTFFYLITLITFYEVCKLWSFWLYSFLSSSVTSPVSGPNTLVSSVLKRQQSVFLLAFSHPCDKCKFFAVLQSSMERYIW
jgi:hypothetical protein